MKVKVFSDKEVYAYRIPRGQSVIQPTGKIRANIMITNNLQKNIKLYFMNSQRYDFFIKSPIGKEVFRWSKGRFFAEATGEEIIEANGNLTYSAELDLGELKAPLQVGEYILEGTITTKKIQIDNKKVSAGKIRGTSRFKIIKTEF